MVRIRRSRGCPFPSRSHLPVCSCGLGDEYQVPLSLVFRQIVTERLLMRILCAGCAMMIVPFLKFSARPSGLTGATNRRLDGSPCDGQAPGADETAWRAWRLAALARGCFAT